MYLSAIICIYMYLSAIIYVFLLYVFIGYFLNASEYSGILSASFDIRVYCLRF